MIKTIKTLNSKRKEYSILNSTFILTLVVAVLYTLISNASFLIALHPANISPLFLASGLALSMAILFGIKSLWGIWLGSFFINTISFYHFSNLLNKSISETFTTLLVNAFIALGVTLSAGIGSYLVSNYSSNTNPFDNEKKVLLFSLLGMITCVISSSVGVLTLSLGGFILWGNFADAWITWWRGDFIGLLIFAPFVLAWSCKSTIKIHFFIRS